LSASVLLFGVAGLVGACDIHMPGPGFAGPVYFRWATLGPDERDFNSWCRHFGNVTPFSDRPVDGCHVALPWPGGENSPENRSAP
jgi:hypothetical protein